MVYRVTGLILKECSLSICKSWPSRLCSRHTGRFVSGSKVFVNEVQQIHMSIKDHVYIDFTHYIFLFTKRTRSICVPTHSASHLDSIRLELSCKILCTEEIICTSIHVLPNLLSAKRIGSRCDSDLLGFAFGS